MVSHESFYGDLAADQLNGQSVLELIAAGDLAKQLAEHPELFNPLNSDHMRYFRALEAQVHRLEEIAHLWLDDHHDYASI